MRRDFEMDGYKVGQWVNNQRAAYRRDQLSAEKIELLEAIDGWEWEPKAQIAYTPEEDKIIGQDSISLEELCRLVPNRSRDAIKARRSFLRAQRGLPAKNRPYSPEEDKILSQDGVSLEELSRRLGRTINSVRNRRYILKAQGLDT
jgi:hypothetical protein